MTKEITNTDDTKISLNNSQEQTAGVFLGLSIEINEQILNIKPRTPINDIKQHGFDCALDKPLKLGKTEDMFDSVLEQLGINYKWDALKEVMKGIPVIQDFTALLGKSILTIEELEIKTPGEAEKANKEERIIISMSITWKEESKIPDDEKKADKPLSGINIKGLYFKYVHIGKKVVAKQ